jgi:anthranilate synthase component 1
MGDYQTDLPKADGAISPGLAKFRELSRDRPVIPVMRRLLADGFTAIGLYEALAANRAGTFLLESAENGRTWSRYSFIGVRSVAMLTEEGGQASWLGRAPAGVSQAGDPLDVLRETVAKLHTPRGNGLPPFTSGMVGCIGYDAVRRWETLPDENPDELNFPELAMLLASDVAVLDHTDGTVLLIANAINLNDSESGLDRAYADAVARLEVMTLDLHAARPTPPTAFRSTEVAVPQSRSGKDKYLADVERAREYIFAGDAFQIVLSQRFETPCPASALDVYRVLRATNPSPYMYLIRLPAVDSNSGDVLPQEVGFDVVGSSPEALVTVSDQKCVLHPIAGTRPRSSDPEQDAQLADDLLADEKERAEHLMLVDLGRNDLGRVCTPGTVDVVEFMQVERYSHVMHLVSTVVGDLAPDKTAYDALAATFPAGTLSGAPKPRAMAIIEELEPARRGLYAGAVGYLDFAGDLDTAIAIRTALIRDGMAYVQAGAGLVADSVPQTEYEECQSKAAAVLSAIASAATMAAGNEHPES